MFLYRSLLVLALVTTAAWSGTPAAPITVTLTQPDGATFSARSKGNYYVSWMETTDGYTVVQASDGSWQIAKADATGTLQPTGIRAENTLRPSVPKGLRPPLDRTRLETYEMRDLSQVFRRGGTDQNILVLLVSFSDITFSYTDASFEDLIFGASDSVKEFYLENSYNQFTVVPAAETQGTSNDGIVAVTLGYNHPNQGQTYATSRTVAIDAVTAANGSVDYSSFDSNGDGDISASELSIICILAGYENAYGGSGSLTPRVWGHRSSFSSTTLDGVDLSPYTMFGERHATSVGNEHQATIGIMCHELGHLMLGLPDLYDRDGSSAGIGDWGLMASGSWNFTGSWSGDRPAHLCAWSKVGVGFSSPSVISTSQTSVTVSPSNQADSVKQVWIDRYKAGEHFLISNRETSDYDAGLPGSGVMIWHIDPFVADQNDNESRKLVDVEAADGDTDLDSNTNDGDTGDPWPGTSSSTTFNGASTPNSNDNDGSATGIAVTNIGLTEASATVDITPATLDPGDNVNYHETSTVYNRGYGTVTAWSALVVENTTGMTSFDGFDVLVPDSGTVDFYLYQSMTGSQPTTLLHSETGFSAVDGWNRFMLAESQEFPDSSERVMVLKIVTDGYGFPVSYDPVGDLSGRSYLDSNGSGSFSSLPGDVFQNALFSSSCSNPAIDTDPSGSTVCVGGSKTFSVTASGSGLSYQWRKDGVDIGGATNATYTLNPVASDDAGEYDCVVDNSCGSVTSAAATLTVPQTTALTGQPSNATHCAGETATFTVTATGSNLSYQWRKDGGNLTGETSATLSIANVEAADAGSYDCVVSGDCGDETSSAASLTVTETTAIDTSPSAVDLCPGSDHTFSVTASGDSLTYQWRLDGIDISGATGSTYQVTDVTQIDEGTYDCVVSGTCGSATSTGATLTLKTATAIIDQPTDEILCSGDNASFSVSAQGENLSYQWRKGGVALGGETSATLTIDGVDAGDEGTYDCVISGDCGSVTSNGASLTLTADPIVQSQPASQTACPGETATFSVTVSGSSLTYQWRLDGVDLGGETSATLQITDVDVNDVGDYDCVINSSCGSTTSNSAALSLNTETSIDSQPMNETLCAGDDAAFTVVASGTELSYQWRKGGVDIDGETSATLQLNGVDLADAGSYDCVVSGTCGSETSTTVTLTITQATSITLQPTNDIVCPGDDASFIVAAQGSNLSYQWRKDGVDLPGETGTSLQITGVVADDQATYDCVVTGDCGAVTSNGALLVVGSEPVISSDPASASRCEGTSVTFGVIASGGSLSYQWRKDSVDIGAATNATLTLSNLAPDDEGSYDCVVTNACGSTTSLAATLTIDPGAFGVTVTPHNPVQGLDIITLTAQTECAALPIEYTWEDLASGTIVGMDATLVLDPPPLEDTTYQLTVVDDNGSDATLQTTVLVNPGGGDANGDGSNDIEDLHFVLPDWLQPTDFDVDGDGILTLVDILHINWGQ